MNHSFEDKTFTQLTYCDYCKRLLWGVVKQGVQCKGCNYICHRKCQGLTPKCSSAQTKHFLSASQKPKRDSLAESYLRQLSQKSGNASDPSSSTKHIPQRQSDSSNHEIESTFKYFLAILTSDKLQDIILEAGTTEKVPVNAYLANQAPLNAQITTKNFTRFVSRCRPVFALRDKVLLLLSWERPIDTSISLILYCLLCFYPKAIFFAPQVLLVCFILKNYPDKKSSDMPAITDPIPTTSDNTTDRDKGEKTKAADVVKKASANKKEEEAPPVNSASSFSFSNIFQPGSDASAEYVSNLQNIQNMMGEFSELYDWVLAQSVHFNWTSESETMRILHLTVVSSVVLGIVLYMVPVHLIFLNLGLITYGLNTRFVKHVLQELRPFLTQFGQQKLSEWVNWYVNMEQKLQKQEALEEISVFENQRWWPKRGYLYEMLENERAPWSNFNGSVCMPIITEIDAPKGYQWKETSEWTLDKSGPWVDEDLNIEICVKPDENGWIYCDDNWQITMPQIFPTKDDGEVQKKGAMTRRRRWIRECEKV